MRARPRINFKAYTLFWKNGEREVIYGTTIEHAFTRANLSAESVEALDVYDHGDIKNRVYNKDTKTWDKRKDHIAQ